MLTALDTTLRILFTINSDGTVSDVQNAYSHTENTVVMLDRRNNEVSISKKEEQTNEEEFDVDKYLDSVTPKSVNISKESLFSSKLSDPALIATREVEVDGPGFTRALEMDNLVDSPRLYYDTQVTMPIESSVMAGDVLVLTFWARKIKCVDESGYAKFNTVY